MKQTSNMSLIFTVFVIFQLGTLRISWDLFRDLFSLILFNLFLLMINNIKEKNNIDSSFNFHCNRFFYFHCNRFF